jgi:transposase
MLDGSICGALCYRPAGAAACRAQATLIEQIAQLSGAIDDYDEQIEQLARERYAEPTRRVEQVPGVGTLTALSFVLTVGEPERFRHSRDVGCYFGLRPRRRQPGECDPQLGISKAGDELVRRLLVQSAHYILGRFGPDSALRQWGMKLAARGGRNAKKRAIVAVARKLAVLLHRLWVTGSSYEPLRSAHSAAA